MSALLAADVGDGCVHPGERRVGAVLAGCRGAHGDNGVRAQARGTRQVAARAPSPLCPALCTRPCSRSHRSAQAGRVGDFGQWPRGEAPSARRPLRRPASSPGSSPAKGRIRAERAAWRRPTHPCSRPYRRLPRRRRFAAWRCPGHTCRHSWHHPVPRRCADDSVRGPLCPR